MSAASLRQKVLDIVYNVWKYPSKYGDAFLTSIMRAPKDGLVSLYLIYSMTTVLNKYPFEYIQHCIPLDKSQRFIWNDEITRVGLKENRTFLETDKYGFARDLDDAEKESDDQESFSVMPVIYEDGKFYIDNEHSRLQNTTTKKCLLQYDTLNIEPLAPAKRKIDEVYDNKHVGPTCFNCDEPGHTIIDCTKPRNRQKIAEKRAALGDTSNKRIHEELEYQMKIDSFKPGTLSKMLREALSIGPEDEPPYYYKMRLYGYPPGYIQYDALQDTDSPPLKIYDTEDYEKSDATNTTADEDKQNTSEKMNNSPIRLYCYPGLDFDTSLTALSQTDADENLIQQQWNEYYAYLYAQQHQQQQQLQGQEQQQQNYYNYYYGSSYSDEYPPGTSVPEMIPLESFIQATGSSSKDLQDLSASIKESPLSEMPLHSNKSKRNNLDQNLTPLEGPNVDETNMKEAITITEKIPKSDSVILINDNESVDMDISTDEE